VNRSNNLEPPFRSEPHVSSAAGDYREGRKRLETEIFGRSVANLEVGAGHDESGRTPPNEPGAEASPMRYWAWRPIFTTESAVKIRILTSSQSDQFSM
jgi:hypothetical protein